MCMGLSSTKCEKQSVRTTLKEFRGCERGFEPHRTREDIVVSQDDHALYLLR